MTIYFSGGLGNQLFQYALYRSAMQKGFSVCADISGYQINKAHNGFEVSSIFPITIDICYNSVVFTKMDIVSRVIRKCGFKKHGVNRNVIREENARYIDNLLSVENKDKLLLGYWQTEKYFSGIRDSLIEELVFPPMNGLNIELANEISEKNAISIHVRRGDYLKFPLYSNICENGYYSRAIEHIEAHCCDAWFYVFSDDVEWCRANLLIPGNVTYVTWNTGKNAYADMQLMSQCKHNIIANSSFSWWGAWLNQNKGKMVVSPKKWFSDGYDYDSSNIAAQGWIEL